MRRQGLKPLASSRKGLHGVFVKVLESYRGESCRGWTLAVTLSLWPRDMGLPCVWVREGRQGGRKERRGKRDR